MPALDTITNTLNYYGGGISLVSLVFSVFLAVLTGNIKKNIKLILEHKDLNDQRAKIQRSLAKNIESICQNIQTDKLFEIYIIAELEEIIGILEQYKKILPLKLRFELFCIRTELKKDILVINQELLCKKLSYIKGILKQESVYIG